MTTSSSAAFERGLDTMLVVYSLLQGHPAANACQQFIGAHSNWFTSPLVLIEAKNILTKVYSVDVHDATTKLLQVATGPIALLDLDEAATISAFRLADTLGLDLTDAVLLHIAQRTGARYLATEDERLAQVCTQLGIAPVSPLNPALRQQIAAWDMANLAPKGLARVLWRVHQWLRPLHTQAADDFWSQTGSGSHLP